MCDTSFIQSNQLLDRIADALVDRGYIILSGVLPADVVGKLLERLHDLGDEDFKRAGIGRQDDFQIDTSVRRDRIHFWPGWMNCALR